MLRVTINGQTASNEEIGSRQARLQQDKERLGQIKEEQNHIINSLENIKDKIDEDFNIDNIVLDEEIEDYREELAKLDSEIRAWEIKKAKISTINNQIRDEVSRARERVQEAAKRRNKTTIFKKYERYKHKNQILQTRLEEIQEDVENIRGRQGNDIDELKDFIFNNSEDLCGFSINFEGDSIKFTTPQGESRDIAAVSKGEETYIELSFRILVWLFLIEKEIVEKGILILDNVDTFFDQDNIPKMKELINNVQERIDFIITSDNSVFIDEEMGFHRININVPQRSLFDF
jgi:DNA repair exonuclease SbcCD ATPase subunit